MWGIETFESDRQGRSQSKRPSIALQLDTARKTPPVLPETAPEHRDTNQPNDRGTRIKCEPMRNCCHAVVMGRLFNLE